MLIRAVGIGDDQAVVALRDRTLHGDIGDARREGAAHAKDLLVDGVGYAMAGALQCLGVDGHDGAEEPLAVRDRYEFIAQLVAPISRRRQLADQHVIDLQHAPVRDVHFARRVRHFDEL